MTNAIADYARQTIRDTTVLGMDYRLDELDDLGSRKQEVPVSGDDLARIVRAQRGTARATGNVDPYPLAAAEFGVWGAAWALQRGGDRRMVAVGVNGLTYDAGHDYDGTYTD
jgi:hypothetical protein